MPLVPTYSLVVRTTCVAGLSLAAVLPLLAIAGSCAAGADRDAGGGRAASPREPATPRQGGAAQQETPAGMFGPTSAAGGPPSGHAPVPQGSVAFQQACLDASADALVLNVAAHPDDEAARTLLVLRRRGIRTVTLYSTWGEGGQNAIGPAIGADLAAIRVQETMAASRHLDNEVRWLGMPDFGYSRSVAETLRVWDHDELVRRMQAAIEDIDPDLVLTNHDLERGHGHHRASALALHEVLRERQTRTRAVPLLERTADAKRATLSIDPNRLDPLSGLTYARLAYDAYLEHETQGPWRPHDPRSVRREHWRLVTLDAAAGAEATAEAEHAAPSRVTPTDTNGRNAGPADRAAGSDPAAGDAPGDVMDAQHQGLLANTALPSLFDEPQLAAAARRANADPVALQRALADFGAPRDVATHVREARRLVPLLRDVAAALPPDAASARRRVERRLAALQRVVRIGKGVALEAWVERTELPRGSDAALWVVVHAVVPGVVQDVQVRVLGAGPQPQQEAVLLAEPAKGGRVPFVFQPTASAPPGGVHVLRAEVSMQIDGLKLADTASMPVREVLAREVAFDRPVLLLPAGAPGLERHVSLEAASHGGLEQHGIVQLEPPPGVQAECSPAELVLNPERHSKRVLVRLRFDRALDTEAVLRARWQDARAELVLRPVQLRIPPRLRVGIVRGTDDALERVLRDLGVECVLLDEERLALQDLAELTTLVLDVRAYQSRDDLAAHRDRLLAFCRRGGRIVAFYHKPAEWNERPGHPALTPFPLVIGDDRVTEEDAPVTRLLPDHVLLREPNRITDGDFAGWVQERGLYFAKTWDAAWTPLLRMHDTGVPPLDGALLYARCGEGDFVYCSLALWRQLREGHAGAVRLLINLLSPS